jgi:hypothetical protein
MFTEDDRSTTPPVALVSAALADRFLTEGAVGRRLWINDNSRGPRQVEVVGVVENVRQIGLDLSAAIDIYVPLRQFTLTGFRFCGIATSGPSGPNQIRQHSVPPVWRSCARSIRTPRFQVRVRCASQSKPGSDRAGSISDCLPPSH